VRPPIFFGDPGATTALVVAFWGIFYLWIGSELWLGYRHRLPRDAGDQDSGSRWWLIASVWGSVALGIGLAFVFPGLAVEGGRTLVLIAGIVLMVAGLALRWYSIQLLGTSFTCEVSTHQGQEVVESGPYRWVRHPSYSGGLLTVLGVLVCCANVVSLAALVIVVAGYANRIRIEERALATDLGVPYRDYMRRTKRLIPFLI
jgi:protein-S-isoprenylcysteine O-methyltransferase Ste14